MYSCPLLYRILTDIERIIGTPWKNNREKNLKSAEKDNRQKKHIWLRPTYNEVQFKNVQTLFNCSASHEKFGLSMRLVWKLIMKPKLSQVTYVSTVHVSWF